MRHPEEEASDRATPTIARVIETDSDLFNNPGFARLWNQEGTLYQENVPAVADAIEAAEAQAEEWV